MSNKEKHISIGGTVVLVLVFVNALILKTAFIQNNSLYNALFITLPLLLLAIYDVKRDKKVRVTDIHANINCNENDDGSLGLPKHRRSKSLKLSSEG